MWKNPFVILPKTNDFNDTLGLIAGQLQMVLESIGGGVPVVVQGRVEDQQMLLAVAASRISRCSSQVCSRLIMLTLPVMMRKRVFRPVMRS